MWGGVCTLSPQYVAPVHLFILLLRQSGAMEGETLQTFYSQLVLMPKVLHYAQYVLLALGCVLLLIPIVYQIRSQVGGGQSLAGAEWPLACLPGGRRGSDQIPQQPLPAVPTDTFSLQPTSGGSPRSPPGLGSCCCILASLACSVTTSLPVLGGLGTLPWRGCRWFWIMRPGT